MLLDLIQSCRTAQKAYFKETTKEGRYKAIPAMRDAERALQKELGKHDEEEEHEHLVILVIMMLNIQKKWMEADRLAYATLDALRIEAQKAEKMVDDELLTFFPAPPDPQTSLEL